MRNGAAYNNSLVQRGSLTLSISAEVLAGWHPAPQGPSPRGGPIQYSEQAIDCLRMRRVRYRLPYRQTEGRGRSLLALLDAEVVVPDDSTLCKRSLERTVTWPTSQSDAAKHIVVDSSAPRCRRAPCCGR